jgi:hypothetical protein
MSEPHSAGHGAFGSAWVEPTDIKRASMSRSLTLAIVEDFKDLE